MSFVRAYLLANLLLVLVALLMFLVRKGSAMHCRPMSYRQQLHLGHALLLAALVAPLLAISTPRVEFLPMTTQVWSASSMDVPQGTIGKQDGVTLFASGAGVAVPVAILSQAVFVLLAAGLALCVIRISAGRRGAARILRRGHLIRRVGTLHIVATHDAEVPFSCWLPGRCYIVVPMSLLNRPEDFRIAVRHEGQHHRQGDTRAVYVLELLRGLFFLNPALHAVLRQLHALEEFACDEAVVDRRVTARAYCACLVTVAEEAARTTTLPACLRMAGAAGGSLLARRVLAVLEAPRQHLRRSSAVAVITAASLLVLGTGVVLSASVGDRRVSLAQVREMAAIAELRGAIPLQVNDEVLAEVNRLVGTPDGRAFTRAALQRMKEHEPMISARLREHALPAALLAVPLVESGYRNLAQGNDARHGAGLWMFIAPTARRFGLEVKPGRDQRLDVKAETTAAMEMFSTLHAEFGNWGLTLLSYNAGSALVRKALTAKGVTDAFTAARAGYQNDTDYVARVMAAIIVLNNVQRLDLQD
jgi:beta-lactamase regulating signal transducer with metallopeptidase domain